LDFLYLENWELEDIVGLWCALGSVAISLGYPTSIPKKYTVRSTVSQAPPTIPWPVSSHHFENGGWKLINGPTERM